jgi:hypothetical protein
MPINDIQIRVALTAKFVAVNMKEDLAVKGALTADQQRRKSK